MMTMSKALSAAQVNDRSGRGGCGEGRGWQAEALRRRNKEQRESMALARGSLI